MHGRNASIITAYTALFTVAAGVLLAELVQQQPGDDPFPQPSLASGAGRKSGGVAPAQSPPSPPSSGLADKTEEVAPTGRVNATHQPGRS